MTRVTRSFSPAAIFVIILTNIFFVFICSFSKTEIKEDSGTNCGDKNIAERRCAVRADLVRADGQQMAQKTTSVEVTPSLFPHLCGKSTKYQTVTGGETKPHSISEIKKIEKTQLVKKMSA